MNGCSLKVDLLDLFYSLEIYLLEFTKMKKNLGY